MTLNDENKNLQNKNIGIIGVPLGFGAGIKGSELGATVLRLLNMRDGFLVDHIKNIGCSVKDYGDVEIVKPNYTAAPDDKLKYLPELLASIKNMSAGIKQVLHEGALPVILGGDHSIAVGTFSAVASFYKNQGKEIGLIWLDAHADINTDETSGSGNLHGMPLAAILGHGNESLVNLEGYAPKLDPRFFAHVGARDLDDGEKRRINELGLRRNFFTMADIDRRGMFECMTKAIEIVSQAPDGFAVTFDIDVIDPRFAPGSGTLVRGGITYREAHLALEMLAETNKMQSFEIVEVNPMLDTSNITVELAGELILSALGKTIL